MKLTAKEREAWDLYVVQRKSASEVGAILGCSSAAVRLRIRKARDRNGVGAMQGRRLAVDTSGARCRCGLRLPCNDCPTIYHYAAKRAA